MATGAASLSTLASTTTSAQVVAANNNRRGLYLYNTDVNDCYVKYGTTASSSDFTVLLQENDYWEMPEPIFTGVIHAIWASDGSGSLFITEM